MDSTVNQLLTKMDGVEAVNNVLVIGMTNRLDMIDDALLRPGRFEVHMEIGFAFTALSLDLIFACPQVSLTRLVVFRSSAFTQQA